MAATYTVGKATALLQTKIKTPDFTPYAASIADEALSFMWDAADWRGSLVELPPFYLIGREQDYGPPFSSVPTDFLQLRRAHIRDLEGNNVFHLNVVASLEPTSVYDIPTEISHEPDILSFRLSPTPPQSWVPGKYQVEGRYKKVHTKVTPDNINSLVLPWDDQYFRVFRKVLEWRWLDEIGSPLAGALNYFPDGSVTASGAAASAFASLQDMVRREGLLDAPETIAPDVELFL